MKKQIAVLMAAATAVTTVAPAIANADVNNHNASVSEITSKVKKALDTKYANKNDNGVEVSSGSLAKDYLNSRYVVLATGNVDTKTALAKEFDSLDESAYKNYNYRFEVKDNEFVSKTEGTPADWYVIDNSSKLATALEANLSDTEAKVVIVDKGADKDGNASRETTKKHYVKGGLKDGDTTDVDINDDQEVSLSATAKTLFEKARTSAEPNKATYVKSLKIGDTQFVSDKKQIKTNAELKTAIKDGVNKVELTLTSNVEYTLEVNDDALDLTEARDKDGNIVKLDANNTQDVMDKIAKFELEANKDDRNVTLDIVNGDTEVYNLEDAVEESLELNNIYTREDGYTSEGKDFVNGIVNAKDEPYKFNFRGTNYIVEEKEKEDGVENVEASVKGYINNQLNKAVIDKSGDGYKLTFTLEVVDANDTAVTKTLKFVVKGDKQRDLYDVLRDLKLDSEVVSGHFTKLAGSNRYATAVEVSAEQFGSEEAESVVIVGGKAQLDGLAAAPLASAKNAPILLADPNTGLSRDTIKEIDRACKSLKNKTVYIVGGEQSVPAKVAKQLEDEFGAVVQRVAGANRRATSLEVAKRLNRDELASKRVFVVGGEGAADAMSVSAVASMKDGKKVSPILVVDAKGVERDTREFLTDDMKLKELGEDGKNKVTQAEAALETAKTKVTQAEAALETAKTKVTEAEAALKAANDENDENDENKIKEAEAALEAAKTKVKEAEAALEAAKTKVKEAEAALEAAKAGQEGQVRLIGGEKSLSTQVLRDLKTTAGIIDTTRISGDNRYDTNVEVIEAFYGKDKIVANGAIFASGENAYLVDAQTSGAFAAYKNTDKNKDNRFPIVLTGNKLTKDQIDLMKDDGVLDGLRSNIYQVGGVVSSDVMKVVVDKLDL